MKKNNRILYLSYDGMTDALGESQVLSYLIGLSNKGYHITLISFEKEDAFFLRKERVLTLCKDANINWKFLKYTSKPPVLSTLYDVYQLKKEIKKLGEFNLVHCRGYLSAIVGLSLKRKNKTPFIFDMRGFWADEKLESGHWAGAMYRPVYNFFKRKEQEFFKYSDVIISLTQIGKEEIVSSFGINSNKIKTIPTCVNHKIFKAYDTNTVLKIKKKLNIGLHEKVMVYSGSLGGNYNVSILIEAFNEFYKQYPQSRLLILTKTIEQQFPNISTEIKDRIIIKSLGYQEVSDYLMIADLGFIFYKKGFSLIGRYPTKLGEYWSCGVPSLIYEKIGDTPFLLDKYPLNGFYYFNVKELKLKMKKFNFSIDKKRIRENSVLEFSLEQGIDFYNSIYKALCCNQ